MNRNITRILPAVALIALGSELGAATPTPPVNSMIGLPVDPSLKDGCNFWVQSEALYMRATEDELQYAIESSSGSQSSHGKVQNAHYHWDWGFRLGVGYNTMHDGWALLLNWTRFAAGDSKSASGHNILPSNVNSSGSADEDDGLHARGHLKLRLNLLDLEMGRDTYISKWLTLRPHFGLRAACIKRNFASHVTEGTTVIGDLEDSMHVHYRGLGLRGGLDSQWGLGSGFSIYTQTALSLLYGNTHLKNEEEASGTGAKNHWRNTRLIADLGLGVRWDRFFDQERYRLRLQLGWEDHIFPNFTKDMQFVSNLSPGIITMKAGDLGLNGVSFQARFDF